MSNIGLAVRFNSSEIREMGRASFGVLGMRLKDSYVVDAEVIEENDRVVLVTERGFGKITKVKEIRKSEIKTKCLILVILLELFFNKFYALPSQENQINSFIQILN